MAKLSKFQTAVKKWTIECFGNVIYSDKTERNYRFLEEALELTQALDLDKTEAHQLVDYVYGREIGIPHQEVGGVMVTLAALCSANNLNMEEAGHDELRNI